MIVTTELTVKQEHIDELGHVNNSVYVKYLEQARMNWYEKAGLSLKQMLEREIGTVVVRLDIQFKKELLLGDRISVHTTPKRLGNNSFVFLQVIKNQEGEIVAETEVTNVMFDNKLRKSIPVAEEIREAFKNR